MKALKLAIATLAATTISSTALSYGNGHRGSDIRYYDAYCNQRDADTYVLEFDKIPVTGHVALPMKRLLSDNCRISRYELRNIDKIQVKAKPYAYSTVTLVSQGWATDTENLYDWGPFEDKEAVFHLNRQDSNGSLQIIIDGDIDLKRVIVHTSVYDNGRYGPAPRGPRGPVYGPGPRGPRGPVYGPGPRGPRGPVYGPAPRGPRGPGYGHKAPAKNIAKTTIRCASKEKQYAECSVKGAVDVRLVNKISEASCRKGYSYGLVNGNGIWVDNGCRGNFEVSFKKAAQKKPQPKKPAKKPAKKNKKNKKRK